MISEHTLHLCSVNISDYPHLRYVCMTFSDPTLITLGLSFTTLLYSSVQGSQMSLCFYNVKKMIHDNVLHFESSLYNIHHQMR